MSGETFLAADRGVLGGRATPDGSAFFDLRQANTGRPGSIITLHADSATSAFEQLTLRMRESKGGRDLPRDDIRGLLHPLVKVVVQLKQVDRRFRMTSSTMPRCAGEGVSHEGAAASRS